MDVGIGVAGVVLDGWNVIVGERIKPNLITFPGGDVEYTDESTGISAVRETFEECGVLTEPVGILFSTFNIINKGKKYVTLYWLLRKISGEPHAKEPDKHRSWEWCPLNTLQDTIWIPTTRIIQTLEVNRIY